MARPKRSKASASAVYHCGMCDHSFRDRRDLQYHVANHADSRPATILCPVCSFPFDDTLAFEKHKGQTGHGTAQLNRKTIHCDRCNDTFVSQKEYDKHRSFLSNGRCADHNHKRTPPKKAPKAVKVNYDDVDQPLRNNDVGLMYDDLSEVSEASTTADGGKHCRDCKQNFASMARYNNHFLLCMSKKPSSAMSFPEPPVETVKSAKGSSRARARQKRHTRSVEVPAPPGPRAASNGHQPVQSIPLRTKPPVSQQNTPPPGYIPTVFEAQNPPSIPGSRPISATPAAAATTFSCSVGGCGKTFRSERGLKIHHADVHGIGGKKLDVTGKDAWMLSQRARELLKTEGPPQAPIGGRHHPPTVRPPPLPTARQSALPSARPSPRSVKQAHMPPTFRMPPALQQAPPQRAPLHQTPFVAPGHVPTSINLGGAAEMDQAKQIQGKILRLLIQSDIFIHHDGKMSICGIDWTRIGTAKQPEVVGLVDKMCHLPKMLQTEYLPPPKAFKDEYTAQYTVTDFKHSPDRDPIKPGLGIVALSCSKIILSDGRQDVVKLAAVDLTTCRILMNHLVCTDTQSQVANWCTPITGLRSWTDMEAARQAGYKIFKGWSAARSALWKFIDKETIIVGHNLRADLDVLRMIHGRAIDVVKLVEKAAKGPLSKAQLSLNSLCKSYAGKQLKSDAEFGRDALMDAFAAREVVLWIVKNAERFERDARQKSVDYQRVMPGGVGA